MKHFLPFLFLGLSGLQVTAEVVAKQPHSKSATSVDTVKVSAAELTGSFPLRRPFATDSVNLSDRQFDPAEVLADRKVYATSPPVVQSTVMP